MDLALDNLQTLICHKIQTNIKFLAIYLSVLSIFHLSHSKFAAVSSCVSGRFSAVIPLPKSYLLVMC